MERDRACAGPRLAQTLLHPITAWLTSGGTLLGALGTLWLAIYGLQVALRLKKAPPPFRKPQRQ
jgi:hypothetical protein